MYAPLHSNYHERTNILVEGEPFGEEMESRMYACRYDISSYLKEGENVIGAWVAPGWYGEGSGLNAPPFGNLKLCFCIKVTEDGKERESISDDSILCSSSFITGYHFMRAEKHDYNDGKDGWAEVDFDDSDWTKAAEIDFEESELYWEDCPGDKEMRTIKPTLIYSEGNLRRYDIGENISGYPVLKTREGAKGTVSLRISECLLEDGTLDEERAFSQKMVYELDGKVRELKPQFTWIAGKYFEVEGDAEVTECVVVHADIPVTSSFKSNNKTLNWIYDAFIRTQLGNMHRGIPSDCPHRERRGYTGDGQLICELGMMTLDSQSFYRKWIRDVSDCQDRISGHVQYTAPYDYTSGGPGGWGCAIVVVPYMYYKHYGDIAPFEEMLPQMFRYFDYLRAHSEGNLVVSDRLWCLGDWATPATNNEYDWVERVKVPAPLVNTYFFVKCIDMIVEMLPYINKEEIKDELLKERKILCDAITNKYFDEATGDFAENIQGANTFAVDIGLGDERTFRNIVKRYEDYGMFDTGIFGTELVVKLLFENDEGDLACKLLTSEKELTFYTMMVGGQDTLWEHWSGDGSRFHPMFGSVVKYMFKNILGIKQKSTSAGYKNIIVEPAKLSFDIDAKGSMCVAGGKITVSRERKADKVLFRVETEGNLDVSFTYGDVSAKVENGLLEVLC